MLAPPLLRAEMTPIADAGSIRAEWVDLARRAIEPNPYYEPDHLAALCRHIRPDEKHWLILVRDRRSGRLDGLFPVTVKGWRDGFPGGVTYMSFDSLIGQTVPLIAGDDPAAVWTAFLGFAADSKVLPTAVFMNEFYTGSPCGQALAKAESNLQASRRVENTFERAVAATNMDHDEYVGRWSGKKARNVRSRYKKLSELGQLDLDIVETGDAAFAATLDAILDLEKAGWKGRTGTALASRDETLDFARSAYAAGGQAPEIHLATLRLDGKLIAGDINLIAQRRAYFIKSAYDEGYSKYGPGVILYAHALEEMLKHGRYERLDSCADAGHPLEEIWLEREQVEQSFVAADGAENKRAISRMAAKRALLFRSRAAVRKAFRLVGKRG